VDVDVVVVVDVSWTWTNVDVERTLMTTSDHVYGRARPRPRLNSARISLVSGLEDMVENAGFTTMISLRGTPGINVRICGR
jgi:hypothetical protein